MYKDPGAQRDAWLTAKTYGLGIVRNDSFVPVGEDYRTGEKLKKYSRDEWLEKTKEDIQEIWDKTKTASKTATDAIKKAYYWTGIWAVTTTGLAAGFGYTLAKCQGDYLDWLKEALLGAMLGSAGALYKHVSKRFEDRQKEKERLEELRRLKELEKNEYARTLGDIRKAYYDMMKQLAASGLELDEKINLKYYMGVDRFTSKLSKSEKPEEFKIGQLNGLRGDLESMKTCMERYTEDKEKRSCNHAISNTEIPNTREDEQEWEEEMVAQL